VPEDSQDKKVLPAHVDPEGIPDLAATKDQLDHLDCRDLLDSLAYKVHILQFVHF